MGWEMVEIRKDAEKGRKKEMNKIILPSKNALTINRKNRCGLTYLAHLKHGACDHHYNYALFLYIKTICKRFTFVS